MGNTNRDYDQQTQDKPREIRGTDGESGCATVSPGQAGVNKDSGEVSRKRKRIYGEVRPGGISSPALLGGILSLEKRKAEEALRNAEECLQWYAREKERALDWLAEISALQAELIVTDEAESSEIDLDEDLTE